jgi:hypothetical protein
MAKLEVPLVPDVVAPPPARFRPTEEQQLYLELLMKPGTPKGLPEIAKLISIDEEDIAAWHRSDEFARWIETSFETQARLYIPLAWRNIMDLMRGGTDAKIRMEATKIFLHRFDRGMGLKEAQVAIAKEAIRKRTTHSTHPGPRTGNRRR